MPPKLESKGVNLNTLLIVAGLVGAVFTTIKIGGPLVNLPEKVTGVENHISDVSSQAASIERTQAVQTEALKTLAEVAKDNRELRRDFDRHAAESNSRTREHDAAIDGVRRRLDRLEQRP